MLKEYKDKGCFAAFADVPPYVWTIFLTPLLFLYLVVVAQAAEVTVKCRGVSDKFGVEDSELTALFIFFEMEVCAFFGMIFGLWVWLSSKYFLNALY